MDFTVEREPHIRSGAEAVTVECRHPGADDYTGRLNGVLTSTGDQARHLDRFDLLTPPDGLMLFVNEVTVNPEAVGRCLGHRLIEHAMAATGARSAALIAAPFGPRATALTEQVGLRRLETYYEKLGFREVARTPDGHAVMVLTR